MVTETQPAPVTFGRFQGHSATESAKEGSSIMLFGKAGSGKTTLAASLSLDPKNCPVWFLDSEGGTKVISDMSGVTVFPIHTWQEQKDFRQEIVKQKAAPQGLPFKTIVIDNLSEVVQQAVTAIVGNATEQVSQPKWGDMAREILSYVRFYRDLARDNGINVVIIAWDSEEKNEITGRSIVTLEATPKLQKELPGILDHIGWITPVDGQPDKRVLSFEPSTRNISKFRRSRTEAARSIPVKIEYGLDNMPLCDIVAAMRGDQFDVKKYQTTTQRNNS